MQQTLLLVLVTRRFVFLCIAKRVTVNGVNVTISLRLGFGEIFYPQTIGLLFSYGHFEWIRYIMWKDSCHSELTLMRMTIEEKKE